MVGTLVEEDTVDTLVGDIVGNLVGGIVDTLVEETLVGTLVEGIVVDEPVALVAGKEADSLYQGVPIETSWSASPHRTMSYIRHQRQPSTPLALLVDSSHPLFHYKFNRSNRLTK